MISNGAESTNQIENENLDVRKREMRPDREELRKTIVGKTSCTRSFA